MSKLPENPTGPEFRAARLAAGIGLRELAAAARRSPATVSRWESGERPVARQTRSLLVATLRQLAEQPQQTP